MYYNFYIDPKNPYCMKKDKEKMAKIELQVSIIYGNIDDICAYLYLLKNCVTY